MGNKLQPKKGAPCRSGMFVAAARVASACQAVGRLRPADHLLISATGASVRQTEPSVPCRGNRQSPKLPNLLKANQRHRLQGNQGSSTSCQARQRWARQQECECLPCTCIQGRLCAVKAPSTGQTMYPAAMHLSESHAWLFGMTPEAPLSSRTTTSVGRTSRAADNSYPSACKGADLGLIQLPGRHAHIL